MTQICVREPFEDHWATSTGLIDWLWLWTTVLTESVLCTEAKCPLSIFTINTNPSIIISNNNITNSIVLTSITMAVIILSNQSECLGRKWLESSDYLWPEKMPRGEAIHTRRTLPEVTALSPDIRVIVCPGDFLLLRRQKQRTWRDMARFKIARPFPEMCSRAEWISRPFFEDLIRKKRSVLHQGAPIPIWVALGQIPTTVIYMEALGEVRW